MSNTDSIIINTIYLASMARIAEKRERTQVIADRLDYERALEATHRFGGISTVGRRAR